MNQPRTRDLRRVIEALEIVEAELRFQIERLKDKPDDEFLTRLCQRYDEATGTIVTLRRYQEGRIGTIAPRPETEFPDDVNAGGDATAYSGDE